MHYCVVVIITTIVMSMMIMMIIDCSLYIYVNITAVQCAKHIKTLPFNLQNKHTFFIRRFE